MNEHYAQKTIANEEQNYKLRKACHRKQQGNYKELDRVYLTRSDTRTCVEVTQAENSSMFCWFLDVITHACTKLARVITIVHSNNFSRN